MSIASTIDGILPQFPPAVVVGQDSLILWDASAGTYVSLPHAGAFDGQYVRRDGTTALTASWNAGAFSITAQAFVTDGGASTDFVKGDGSLDSTTYVSGAAGSDTQIQYNNAGAFGASADFAYDGAHSVELGSASSVSVGNGNTMAAGVIYGANNTGISSSTGNVVIGASNQFNASVINSSVSLIGSFNRTEGTVVVSSAAVGTSNVLSALGTTAVGFNNQVTASNAVAIGQSLVNGLTNSALLGLGNVADMSFSAAGIISSFGQILETDGSIEAVAFITDGGASTDFVKGDGSLDSTVYTTEADTDATHLRLDATNSPLTNSLTINTGTDGDAVLSLVADTDNSNEDDNPYVFFSQDGALVTGGIGLTNTTKPTSGGSVLTNGLLVWNDYATGSITHMIGTTKTLQSTSSLTNIYQALDVASTVSATAFITDGGASTDFVKGDGTLDATTYVSGAAGSDTQVQLNASGAFGASANFSFTTSLLTADTSAAIIGDNNTHTDGYVIGSGNTVDDAGTIVLGNDNTAANAAAVQQTIVVGSQNSLAERGLAVGFLNQMTTVNAFALGNSNNDGGTANGTIFIGDNNTNAASTLALSGGLIGTGNSITGGFVISAFAMGLSNTVSASGAVAIGSALTNSTGNSTMLGYSTGNLLCTTSLIDSTVNISAPAFVTDSGTSSQFVKGDGSLDSTTYAPAADYVPYTGATGDVDLGANAITAEKVLFNNWGTHTLTGDGETIQHNDYPAVLVDATLVNAFGGLFETWNTAIADGSYTGQLLTIRLKVTADENFQFAGCSLKVILTSPARAVYSNAPLFSIETSYENFDLMWDGTDWKATDGLTNNDWTGGKGAWAGGFNTTASGVSSHAEGNGTTASGTNSHAEGTGTTATGGHSHAEGSNTDATGQASHAQGNNTLASGTSSHAEGQSTTASNSGSHAEGNRTVSSGNASHAQGNTCTASGTYSHAGGEISKASGYGSFTQGKYVEAQGDFTAIFGWHTNTLQTFTETKFFIMDGIDFWISDDNKKQYFGVGKDVSTTFDGSDWIFNSENVTANDEVHFTNFAKYTFDNDIETTGGLTLAGGLTCAYVAKTANYTLTVDDYTVNVTANTTTQTLPTAVGVTGQIYNIKNTASGTTQTIATTSSQTIDGVTTASVAYLTNVKVQSDGANWIVL